nr:RecName: Full=Venom peptide 3; AltName: Full=BaP-3 [Brotheas amazonicus]
IGDIWSGIQG